MLGTQGRLIFTATRPGFPSQRGEEWPAESLERWPSFYTEDFPLYFYFWLSQIFLGLLQVLQACLVPPLGFCDGDSFPEAPGRCSFQAYVSTNELAGASWPIFPLIQDFLLLFLFLLPTVSSSCSHPSLYPGISLPALSRCSSALLLL